jgi:hypothetical protein
MFEFRGVRDHSPVAGGSLLVGLKLVDYFRKLILCSWELGDSQILLTTTAFFDCSQEFITFCKTNPIKMKSRFKGMVIKVNQPLNTLVDIPFTFIC